MKLGALVGIMFLACRVALGNPETYVWTNGALGFYGSITLDSSSSPPGGGSGADIVSGVVGIGPIFGPTIFIGSSEFWNTVPDPLDPPGSGAYDPLYIESSAPFTWNPEDITSMNMVWGYPNGDAVAFVDANSLGEELYFANDRILTDTIGYWQGIDPPVPDEGNAAALLGTSGLSLFSYRSWTRRIARPPENA